MSSLSKDTNQASEKQKMRLEMRNINDLIPYENNARMHSVEQILIRQGRAKRCQSC